jgi:hypothetical protein
LSWIEIPLDDDPVDRCAKYGAIEIKLCLVESRLPLLDNSLRILEIGLGHVSLGVGNRNGLRFHLDLLKGCTQIGSPSFALGACLAQIAFGAAAGAALRTLEASDIVLGVGVCIAA